jgi:hypothetical protein
MCRKGDGDKPLEIDESNDDNFYWPGQYSLDSQNSAITANQGTASRETAEKHDR